MKVAIMTGIGKMDFVERVVPKPKKMKCCEICQMNSGCNFWEADYE